MGKVLCDFAIDQSIGICTKDQAIGSQVNLGAESYPGECMELNCKVIYAE